MKGVVIGRSTVSVQDAWLGRPSAVKGGELCDGWVLRVEGRVAGCASAGVFVKKSVSLIGGIIQMEAMSSCRDGPLEGAAMVREAQRLHGNR